ncbi:AAA family ATPase [Mucilaginibacter lacusdianchii]|uniref:AAA family ATPase n=1 Tax=Mucilaginibacter lacusdianchii TaxID=2684211 RepID=UPI00131B1B7F|nr:AAA family ATPase [Mucilaginibacter sp. JXJ CY 39]
MGIERVVFDHYRCFDHLELNFRRKVNLFIGDNSSGKSTIVQGLTTVLNSFFSGFSDDNTRFYGLQKADFTEIGTGTGLANEAPIAIGFRFLNVEAKLELHSKKGRTLQKPLDPIYHLGKELYTKLFDEDKTQATELPLLASFSTSDIHVNRKNSIRPFMRYDHKPSFGYYECLQGDGFLTFWTKRLLILKEASKGEMELEGVRRALIDALGPEGCGVISDMSIRHNQGRVYYWLTDGREVDTDSLSDGYRRLVNIVIDIAFRCMILNQGIFGQDACRRTQGTVLVDEIDLHLHPSLQARVIKGLRMAFPQVQWIITTHAPMVMTEIELSEDNVIHKLRYCGPDHRQGNYAADEIELYGLDASSIIDSALHTTPRSAAVDKELTELFNLIEEEKTQEAGKLLGELRARFGDGLPDLTKAETLLNFYMDADDQDQ